MLPNWNHKILELWTFSKIRICRLRLWESLEGVRRLGVFERLSDECSWVVLTVFTVNQLQLQSRSIALILLFKLVMFCRFGVWCFWQFLFGQVVFVTAFTTDSQRTTVTVSERDRACRCVRVLCRVCSSSKVFSQFEISKSVILLFSFSSIAMPSDSCKRNFGSIPTSLNHPGTQTRFYAILDMWGS